MVDWINTTGGSKLKTMSGGVNVPTERENISLFEEEGDYGENNR